MYLVDAESCQEFFCQSNNDCKAFIYNSTESESGCHIFNKNLNWERCEKIGAYISDNINKCRNEPGHHSPLGCEVIIHKCCFKIAKIYCFFVNR